VSPGKVADLVLLNANPFDDVQNAFRQDGVMPIMRKLAMAEA